MFSRKENLLLFAGVFILIVTLLIVGRGNVANKNVQPTKENEKVRGADTTDYFDQNFSEFVDKCVNEDGGVVALKGNDVQCLEFDTGLVLGELTASRYEADITGYLKYVYPVYPSWDSLPISSQSSFLSTLSFAYYNVPGAPLGLTKIDSTIAVKYIEDPVFYNTSHIEVYPLESSFKNFSREEWRGCWYRGVLGSGWYLPVSCTLMAYNALHALVLLGISNNEIATSSSSVFKALLTTTSLETLIANCSSPSFTGAYLNQEFGPQRYLAQSAAMQGYKTIQLSNERNAQGKIERWFVHLTDPNYSQRFLTRRNPFSILPNLNDDALYLNSFLADTTKMVDVKYIIDPNPKTLGERYGDFSFKTSCRLSKGTINIGDLLLDCLKILNFGLPAVTLNREIDFINFSSYPQNTTLEKLQSYFSIVYGSPNVWKTKSLEELTDYWTRCEVHYKLPIDPNLPYNNYRLLSFGVATPISIDARQEENRPGEVVQYVEVIRQNKKYSRYGAAELFAATYYYPARGSGLFLPTGRMLVARNKQQAAGAFGQTIPPCCVPEDIAIAKIGLYKGFDTMMIVRYSGFTADVTELVHFRDPIASQMSLVRTHPYDPILSLKNTLISGDEYFENAPLSVETCVIYSQYEPGKGYNECVD